MREWSGGYASRVPRCIWHVSQGTLALRCMPRRGMSQTQRVPCGAHAPFQPISAAKCHPAENSSCVWFIVVSDGTLQCLLYSHPIFTHSVVRSNGRRDWCEAWCELRRCSTLYLVSTRGWYGAKNLFSPKIDWIHREGPNTVYNIPFILKLDSKHRPQRPKRVIFANIGLLPKY